MSNDPATSSNPIEERTDAPEDDQACAVTEDVDTARVALVAFYADADTAHRHLEILMRGEAPMDRISVLGRADSSGDDPLGIYYGGVGERMRGWGGLGALWGGLFGLLSGATGLFILPGVGPMVAAGPLVAALTGAAAGAGAGGVLMAGAGAAQQLAVAIHRLGVPESCIDAMQKRLARGETLVMLILAADEAERWRPLLEGSTATDSADDGAEEPVARPVALWKLPYTGVAEAVREQL
jgi:hypothetical protein